jgi:hypothetical protein
VLRAHGARGEHADHQVPQLPLRDPASDLAEGAG